MGAETLALRIIETLRSAGYTAWLVGGCVRDLFLGRVPKDFDVATSATPDQLTLLFPHADRVGAHFGVLLVHEGNADVEVATYRHDSGYADGRHPESVQFETDPARDAARRDFTINGLFLDPLSGEVLDFTGGRADLAAGVIRAIGDPEIRFAEDHLRMLRAVRFASRLDFTIEPRTLAAIRTRAANISSISAERIRDELILILTENPARGLELLDATALLPQILPEVAAMKGVEQPPEFHPEGDVWVHTLAMLKGLENPSPALALGVLLHDVGKPPTFTVTDRIRFNGHVEVGVMIAKRILERLRFPNHVIDSVCALVDNHMRFMDVPRMKDSTLKRFLRMPDFEDHMRLHRLDCLSSHGSLANYELVREKQQALPPEVLKPPPLLTGRDLIAKGYCPGPAFGKTLHEVEDAQLEGRVTTREEALALAADLLK